MKILITWRKSYGKGGVANYFTVLEPYLPRSIEYFIFYTKPGLNLIRKFKYLLRDYLKFRRILDDYDIIHVNPSLRINAIIRDGFLINAAKNRNKKVIVFFRGWNKKFESSLRKSWLWLFKKYYFQTDGIIILANEFKDSLLEMGYKGKIFLETTIVDDALIPDNINNLKPDNKPINILFLSRVEKTKGIYETIKTIIILRKKGVNVTLTIAGDGSELEYVKKYVSGTAIKNEVSFLGYVRNKEKASAFENADVFLLPSHGEGMPNSVLEAMAFGLPIITRPVGGIKDFFEDKKMGFITTSLEAKAFSKLIEKLICNPGLMQQISRYNYQYAKKRFRASVVASRLENIYREIMED